MRINHDRLKKPHCLLFRGAFCIECGSCGSTGCQFSQHFHIPEKQGACNQIRIIGIEGNCGLPLALRFGGQTFRNVEESVDFPFLYGNTCITHIAVMGDDTCLRKSVQIAHDVAGGR